MINNRAREIAADDYSDRQAQIDNTLMDLHTCLPAIIMSYDAETRTVAAQPTIQRVFTDGEGMSGAYNLPPCVDVPVIFPGGGGFEITFPVKEGDECLLIFAERCIDSWFTSGEINVPADYRQHDLSDAIAIVGLKSMPNALPTADAGMNIGSAKNKIAISDDDVSVSVNNSKRVIISDDDINLSLTDDESTSEFQLTKTEMSANVNGALMFLNNEKFITSVPLHCPNVITDKIDVNNHLHGGVEVGLGDTMKPKNG